jgi:hypothetical protein
MYLNKVHSRVFILTGFVAAIFTLLWTYQARAQNLDASAILSNSMSAMGGAAAWSNVNDATEQGVCQQVVAGATTSQPFNWVTTSNEFRYEYNPGSQSAVYLSGNGTPQYSDVTGTTALPINYYTQNLPFHAPGLYFQRFLSESGYWADSAELDSVNGAAAYALDTSLHQMGSTVTGSQVRIWIDVNSNLPIQMSYSLPDITSGQNVDYVITFTGWSAEGNLLIPHQISRSLSGNVLLQSCAVQSTAFNSNPAPTVFSVR